MLNSRDICSIPLSSDAEMVDNSVDLRANVDGIFSRFVSISFMGWICLNCDVILVFDQWCKSLRSFFIFMIVSWIIIFFIYVVHWSVHFQNKMLFHTSVHYVFNKIFSFSHEMCHLIRFKAPFFSNYNHNENVNNFYEHFQVFMMIYFWIVKLNVVIVTFLFVDYHFLLYWKF